MVVYYILDKSVIVDGRTPVHELVIQQDAVKEIQDDRGVVLWRREDGYIPPRPIGDIIYRGLEDLGGFVKAQKEIDSHTLWKQEKEKRENR